MVNRNPSHLKCLMDLWVKQDWQSDRIHIRWRVPAFKAVLKQYELLNYNFYQGLNLAGHRHLSIGYIQPVQAESTSNFSDSWLQINFRAPNEFYNFLQFKTHGEWSKHNIEKLHHLSVLLMNLPHLNSSSSKESSHTKQVKGKEGRDGLLTEQ